MKSQQLFSKSRDFDSHRRKLVTSFCPLFFILNQLSHRLEHNLAVDHLMKPSVILKFHRGNTIPQRIWKVNNFFQAFISFHRMTASALVGRETNRRQFLEEHSINRPFLFALDPQTQFTGFTFLHIVFIVEID